MKERPILFSAPMVRAILDGSKTQTRRIVNPRMYILIGSEDDGEVIEQSNSRFGEEATRWSRCPYGAPGDRLWVRETWQALHFTPAYDDCGYSLGYADDWRAPTKIPQNSQDGWWTPVYAATDPFAQEHRDDRGFSWRPGIHMPRWASRITLEVTGARVERLQDISEEDARAEGIEPLWRTRKIYPSKYAADVSTQSFRDGFYTLWCEINGRESWDANPWVWVVEFKRLERP